MDYQLDTYLDSLDACYNENEFVAGWDAAHEGRAWTCNGGIGVSDGTAVSLVEGACEAGVRAYWEHAGYTRPKSNDCKSF